VLRWSTAALAGRTARPGSRQGSKAGRRSVRLCVSLRPPESGGHQIEVTRGDACFLLILRCIGMARIKELLLLDESKVQSRGPLMIRELSIRGTFNVIIL
jgi:hypothetical protein